MINLNNQSLIICSKKRIYWIYWLQAAILIHFLKEMFYKFWKYCNFLKYYWGKESNKAVMDDCLGPRFLWKNYINVHVVIAFDILSSFLVYSTYLFQFCRIVINMNEYLHKSDTSSDPLERDVIDTWLNDDIIQISNFRYWWHRDIITLTIPWSFNGNVKRL